MSNFTDFFPAAGGGGGGIPKYQEFTSSGTFTPSQALIDAGGRIGLIVVGAGGGGTNTAGTAFGGVGGEVKIEYNTLTSTNAITVTIGAGGVVSGTNGTDGTSTTFAASSAGGTDVVSAGGMGAKDGNQSNFPDITNTGAGFPGLHSATGPSAGGSGIMGYGVGGGTRRTAGSQNSDSFGSGGGGNQNGGDGFVRLTWFE
jgi:hypothetical protein